MATMTSDRTDELEQLRRHERVQRLQQLREMNDELRDRPRVVQREGAHVREQQLTAMRERVEQARAERVLAQVRDSSWWTRASVGDLERAQHAASMSNSPASHQIRARMEDTARARYGTDLRGAITYERENPNQPPPDVRSDLSTGPRLSR